MHTFRNIFAITLVTLLAAIWWIAPATAQEADTVAANVILCADPDCADTVDLETMYGATVTSYAPDGSMVGTCTVTETPSGMSNCDLVPAPDRGSYDIWPADPYVGYVLLSAHPEIFESEMHGPIYVWYFAPEKDNIAPPPSVDQPDTAYANVIVCADQACADGANTTSMGGATITSYNAAGEVIDACEVVTYPSGMDGCNIIKHAGDGSYQVTPTADYAGYNLLSTEPVVLESMSHGTQLHWFYAPAVSRDAPSPTAPAAVVTELPSTGVGAAASGIAFSAYVMVPFALAGAGLVVKRFLKD